jgi:hypothetical protein
MTKHTARRDSQFPEIYSDGIVRIYRNPSREIFVEDVRSGTKIRPSSCPYAGGGLQFTTDSLVEPVRVTNMIGWRVGPR